MITEKISSAISRVQSSRMVVSNSDSFCTLLRNPFEVCFCSSSTGYIFSTMAHRRPVGPSSMGVNGRYFKYRQELAGH